MNDKLLQILINPQEAQIIELSLVGDKHKSMRYLLLRIGAILVTKQGRVVATTVDELWYLRDHINYDLVVGDVMALDLVINIYNTLCKHYDMILEPLEYITYEPEKMQII